MTSAVNFAKMHLPTPFSAAHFSGNPDKRRLPNDKPRVPLTADELSTFNMLVEGLPEPEDLKGAMVLPDFRALEARYAGQRDAFVDDLINRLDHPAIRNQRDLFEHGLWVRSQISIGSGNSGDRLRGHKVYISPFIEDDVRDRVPYLKPAFYMQQAFNRSNAGHVEIEEDPEHWFRLERRFIDYYA